MFGLLFHLVIAFAVNGLAFWAIETHVFPEYITLTGSTFLMKYFTVGVVFALFHMIIHPLLSLILTPLRWMTFGLVGVLLHGLILFLVSWVLVAAEGMTQLTIAPWYMYVVIGAILSAVNTVLHWID